MLDCTSTWSTVVTRKLDSKPIKKIMIGHGAPRSPDDKFLFLENSMSYLDFTYQSSNDSQNNLDIKC